MNPIPASYTCTLLGTILKNTSIYKLILKVWIVFINSSYIDKMCGYHCFWNVQIEIKSYCDFVMDEQVKITFSDQLKSELYVRRLFIANLFTRYNKKKSTLFDVRKIWFYIYIFKTFVKDKGFFADV